MAESLPPGHNFASPPEEYEALGSSDPAAVSDGREAGDLSALPGEDLDDALRVSRQHFLKLRTLRGQAYASMWQAATGRDVQVYAERMVELHFRSQADLRERFFKLLFADQDTADIQKTFLSLIRQIVLPRLTDVPALSEDMRMGVRQETIDQALANAADLLMDRFRRFFTRQITGVFSVQREALDEESG